MVQRKLPRKKPKDSADASKNGLPADSGCRGGGTCAGGVAMARAVLPSYMRTTSSSSAKAGPVGGEVASAAPPERETVRAKVVFGSRTPYVSRGTCSSAMKGPSGGGHAAAAEGRVCTYAYCSLKGHVHAPVVPLGSFVASRRRLIKTGQSMKLKGVSPFRKTNNGGGGVDGEGDGFFVEVYTGAGTGATAVSSDVNCSNLATEEMDGRMEYVTFDRGSCWDMEDKVTDPDASVDGSCGSSDVISDGFAELLGTTKSRGHRKEEIDEDGEASVDQGAEDFGACKSDISEELDAEDGGNISEDRRGDASEESSINDISNAFGRMIFKDECSDPIDATTCKRNKLMVSRRGTPKEGKRVLTFNPRAPNILPVKPHPDAEKVDLRHQMTDDRKGSEEWMVDYALRKAVKKLARAQKRKVEMLVQAFETVLPPVADDKKSVQHNDDKNLTQTRPWQACN